MDDHENHLCAALGHFIGTIVVVYCPHHQAWTLIERAGDDADDSYLDVVPYRFGPFDSSDDVANHTASVAQKLVRVTSRRWLHDRGRRS